jgi:molecular chaperone GrpE
MARKKQQEPSEAELSAASGEERVEGWEGLAGEEPTGGTLAPSDELEAALREASEAVTGRERGQTPVAGGSGEAQAAGAEEMLLEALSTELQTLKTEYEASQSELEKIREQHLRLQAEFENFRRRGLKEKQETQLYGHQNLVKELLPTVDNLDRAIEHAEQNESGDLQQLLQGVELVRRDLLGVLERFGVTGIEAEGAAFDPAIHEAMAQTPTAEVEPNTVVSVMETGYLLRDRMLRPARVVVSKAPEEEAQPEPDSEE